MISNCGHDENRRYRNGTAGDQTGEEYCIRTWYNRPWNCVLRYPDEKVGSVIGSIASYAANNALIGYDQNQRTTFYQQLSSSGWHPENIRVACEADCSASTAAVVIAAGHRLGIASLANVNPNLTTYNMRAALKAVGFEVLTDSRYLSGESYLAAGDILLNDQHHVAINLTYGGNYKVTTTNTNIKAVNYAAQIKVSDFLNVRTAASGDASIVILNGHGLCLPNGLVIAVNAESGDWARLAGTDYWVSKAYLKK